MSRLLTMIVVATAALAVGPANRLARLEPDHYRNLTQLFAGPAIAAGAFAVLLLLFFRGQTWARWPAALVLAFVAISAFAVAVAIGENSVFTLVESLRGLLVLGVAGWVIAVDAPGSAPVASTDSDDPADTPSDTTPVDLPPRVRDRWLIAGAIMSWFWLAVSAWQMLMLADSGDAARLALTPALVDRRLEIALMIVTLACWALAAWAYSTASRRLWVFCFIAPLLALVGALFAWGIDIIGLALLLFLLGMSFPLRRRFKSRDVAV